METRTFSIEEITSPDLFLSIRDEWNALLTNSKQDSIFFRHEWYQCCWAGINKDSMPWILLIRDGEELIGAAPLVKYTEKMRGFPVRKIGFLSTLDSFHADFIVRERKEEVMEEIIDYLLFRSGEWDILHLSRISKSSNTPVVLEQIALKKQLLSIQERFSKNLFLPLTQSWDNYYQEKSVKFKKTHRNIYNRINKAGSVSVERHTEHGKGKIFDDVVKISEKSWKAQNGVALACGAETRRFFSELTRLASDEKWLMVWFLRIDGVPVAMEYDLQYNGKVYGLRADYDESYNNISPGSYLNYHIIKTLFDDRYLEYDMGPGMNDYKTHWTDTYHETFSYEIYNSKFYPRLLYYLGHKLIPTLRKFEFLRRLNKTFGNLLRGSL